jgi:hypothetical protein
MGNLALNIFSWRLFEMRKIDQLYDQWKKSFQVKKNSDWQEWDWLLGVQVVTKRMSMRYP